MATTGASNTQRDITGELCPTYPKLISVPPAYLAAGAPATSTEFSETSTVSLEWRLTGLRQMYETTKGNAKR